MRTHEVIRGRIMTTRSIRGLLYDAYATMAAAEPY